METLAVASTTFVVGFLFGMWFYAKVMLPAIAKKVITERSALIETRKKKIDAEKLDKKRKENPQ